jgi:hypothetical protein
MSWWPHFLTPWSGVIAAGLTVPPLVLLYFLKLRRREHPVSSTILWKKAVQDLQVNAPFQKLRRNLLLLLQLLALLLGCLALARPISFYTPGAGSNTIILIDRSASMNAVEPSYGNRTRLEEAKRRAKDLVDTMQRNATGMVVAFDDSAQLVASMTPDTMALKKAIDSIGPSDRRTRARLAFRIAEAQATYDPEMGLGGSVLPEAVVFSDGRVLDSESDLQFRGKVRFERVGTDELNNVAIVAMSARRNFERPTEVQVFARLANYGPTAMTSDVQLEVAELDPSGAGSDHFIVRGVAAATLAPERWSDPDWAAAHPGQKDEHFQAHASVDFTLDLTTAAIVRVRQIPRGGPDTAPDALAADDVAQVVVPPPKALSVLLVSQKDYFLEKVLHSLNLKEPAEMTPAEYEQKVPPGFDLIIFDGGYTPPKLPSAGNFIYFGSVAPGLRLKAQTEAGVPIMADDQGVLDWQRDHPILKGLSLSHLYVHRAVKLAVPQEDVVLVEGTKCPLVVLHREGRSAHLVVSFDAIQSTWPTSVTFPVFMYNALQFLAVSSDLSVREAFAPGDTPRIPRLNLAQATGGATLKSLRLIDPNGAGHDVDIPPQGDFALPPLEHVGIYRTDPPIPQFERIAVNLLDANESNLVPVDRGVVGESSGPGATRRRLDLWW